MTPRKLLALLGLGSVLLISQMAWADSDETTDDLIDHPFYCALASYPDSNMVYWEPDRLEEEVALNANGEATISLEVHNYSPYLRELQCFDVWSFAITTGVTFEYGGSTCVSPVGGGQSCIFLLKLKCTDDDECPVSSPIIFSSFDIETYFVWRTPNSASGELVSGQWLMGMLGLTRPGPGGPRRPRGRFGPGEAVAPPVSM